MFLYGNRGHRDLVCLRHLDLLLQFSFLAVFGGSVQETLQSFDGGLGLVQLSVVVLLLFLYVANNGYITGLVYIVNEGRFNEGRVSFNLSIN